MGKLDYDKAKRRDLARDAHATDHYAWPKSKATHTAKAKKKSRPKQSAAINPRAYKSTPRTTPRTRTDRHGIEWPIVITTGPLTDNGLTSITLNNREHADTIGFSWIGRSR